MFNQKKYYLANKHRWKKYREKYKSSEGYREYVLSEGYKDMRKKYREKNKEKIAKWRKKWYEKRKLRTQFN